MDYACNHRSYNIRRTLKLVNEIGETIQMKIIYDNAARRKTIRTWRKLYGKKFEKLIIYEIYTPLQK